MEYQKRFIPDVADRATPVCPQAFDRLWQAAYGAPMSRPGAAESSDREWRPFDARQPVMPLLRACAVHLQASQVGGAMVGLQVRLLQLSVWLCSDEAPASCGELAAWTFDGAGWRLVAVHRDLLSHAAQCLALAALQPRLRLLGACTCRATS
ncbi:MAG: hypothetical protein ACK4R2_10600 [Roseateles sp.]